MEAAGSDGENQNQNNDNINKISNSSEGLSKPKRQMKTPFQLENLEKAYALETYPSESTRAELSEKLGLSDRQLQMWFCHRRLKDKKEPTKKPRKVVAPTLPDSPIDEQRAVAEPGSDYGSGSGSGSSPFGDVGLRNVMPRSVGDDVPMMRRYYEPSRSIMELRAITCVESQLGEPLREDGPILGIEFDPLPPDAFGAPIASEQQKRSGHSYGDKYEQRDVKSNKATPRALPEYPFLQDPSTIRADMYGPAAQSHYPDSLVEVSAARTPSFLLGHEQLSRSHNYHGQVSRVRLLSQQEKQGVTISPVEENEFVPPRDSFANVRMNAQFTDHPVVGPDNSYVLPDGNIFPNDAIVRVERKRKSEEARVIKEVEAHEIRIRKELEKQDNLRKKSEERMRKEMEKQDRERRKEEERLMRERQREAERLKREEKRENERREKFLQREYLRAEKRKQREAMRKEKEAVRRKAAIEKATARRIARESMELIEDEQLELMELAAASKGLSLIISLDHDTMQNLESFRDFRGAFPPKSVHLKKPFGIQPWVNSEENIGNLLMVWRFFITFSDVLELWPFTLDEFVQALHDYDSRLLGEIHICLLRLIVKDIEDVARTPSNGLGMNQNGVPNNGGGHPQIVEGAYAWGFDICNWKQHLNPLTWPEIFRQLALSAGFGPQLKKRSVAWSDLHSNDEGKCGQDIVSTLRNGSAAENAFAIMQEKGLLAPRRSRHRLTPGTVKFAAFHVLSFEGSEGLTVLELADKIQRSGLRDLTTSKTPEASISVALTRDTKLFERIAPSTYRVRAPYRKDPDEAEEILSVARKKIQIFQNGFLPGEDADDVERDEESECDDVDEDPEVDDVATTSLVNEDLNKQDGSLGVDNENLCHEIPVNPQNEEGKDLSSFHLSGSQDSKYSNISTKQYAAVDETANSDLDQENMEIDESKEGESWIQGLTEGEYHDLSVEERLNALVALTGIANEGNSIRLVLEDRLEAANAVKKQMLAEAQIDKTRVKEEIITKSDFSIHMGSKADTELNGSAIEGGQSPLPVVDNRNNEATPSTAENLTIVPNERTPFVPDFFYGPDNFLSQQYGHASKRSRSQLKSYIAHKAEEMYTYRSLPLGRDRRRNRYWQFVASTSSNDPGSGRIFVETYDGKWRLIDSEEGFDTLSTSLDTRGIRESHLRIMLQMIETSFKENVRRNLHANVMVQSGITLKNENDELNSSPECTAGFNSPSSTVCGLNLDTMVPSSSFRIELGRNENEKKAAFRRYQELQRWMLKDCFNSSTLCAMKFGKKRCTQVLDVCDSCLCLFNSEHSHCSSCHQTFGINGGDFNVLEPVHQCENGRKSNHWDTHALDSSLPLKSRLLEALFAFMEAHVPSEALHLFWTEECRKNWGIRLNTSSSIEELLQILTVFESGVKRDFLKSNFATTEELLSSSSLSGNVIRDPADVSSILILPWIPRTSAAIALRLFELDASIAYIKCEKPEPDLDTEVGEYINFPTRYVHVKNDERSRLNELDYDDLVKGENSADPKSLRNSYKRGRGSRDQGRRKKWQKKVNGSKSDSARQNAKSSRKINQGPKHLGHGTQMLGARGRRTVRKRRAENSIPDETLLGLVPSSTPQSREESPKTFIAEWDDDKVDRFHMEDEENANHMEPMDSDDEAQAVEYEQGNWEFGFDNTPNRWNGDLGVASDEDIDLSEEYNGTEEVGNEDLELDVDTSDESDGSGNRIGNNEGGESAVSEEDYSD